MVALPILGLSGAAIVYSSSQASVEDQITTQLGANESRINVMYGPNSTLMQDPVNPFSYGVGEASGDLQDPRDVLPAGTRILPLTVANATVETASGIATLDLREGPSWDESFAGMHDVVAGRTPRNDGEVMVTASLLPRLGITIGGTFDVKKPLSRTVTVVGILDDQTRPDADQWLFARTGALTELTDEARIGASSYFLPDTALTWDDVKSLNGEGMLVLSKAVLLADLPPGIDGSPYSESSLVGLIMIVAIFAGFATFEVILLAGAAFTVTARQQQRTLATMASVGAPRGVVFRVITANGVVLGAVGGIVGAALGVVGAFAFMALTANGSSTQYYGMYIPWLALIGFAFFAVVMGWLASVMPAHNASRFDIVAALRGARKPAPPGRRTPAIGLGMLITGIVLTVVGGILLAVLQAAGRGIAGGHPLLPIPILMLVLGPVLAQLGIVLCGPLVLRGIARVLSRGGIGARLGSRDAARNSSRAVPALAAVMTTMFVAVFAMSMMVMSQEGQKQWYNYGTSIDQVRVPLQFTDHTDPDAPVLGQYENSDAVTQAIRSAVDVDVIRVLSAVPDPFVYDPNVASDQERAQLYALPAIPLENRCPSDPLSPEFTGVEQYEVTDKDWRCSGSFVFTIGATTGHITVGDASDLALALGREPSAEAKRTLESGGAVSFYPHYVHDDTLEVEWRTWEQIARVGFLGDDDPVRAETLKAVVDLPDQPIQFAIFVSPATADRLGLEYDEAVVLASTTETPTDEQAEALALAVEQLPDAPPAGTMFAQIERGPQDRMAVWVWGLLGVAGLIALASSAVAIGLARIDGRADSATLAALGAGPLVRRSFAFWQALIIAGIGSALGAGMALVPAWALSANPDLPFAPPWLQIGLAVVALPLAIAVGSWLTSSRGAVTTRRMSIA